jgi:predicted transcriptional regulator
VVDKREKIVQLFTAYPDMSVRELAYRSGADRDTVRDVLVEHLVQTRGTLVPRLRRIADRIASL